MKRDETMIERIPDLTESKQRILEQLIYKLSSGIDPRNIQVKPISLKHEGRSGKQILLMQTYYEPGRPQIPSILHFDEAERLQHQVKRYKEHVAPYLSRNTARLEENLVTAADPETGIVYGLARWVFVGDEVTGEGHSTLRKYLLSGDGSIQAAAKALSQLFGDTVLKTLGGMNSWHYHTQAAIRPPIWFYNRVLKGAFRLSHISFAEDCGDVVELTPEMLVQADRPPEPSDALAIDKRIAIRFDSGPFRLAKKWQEPGRIYLELRDQAEHTQASLSSHAIIDPIVARIDLPKDSDRIVARIGLPEAAKPSIGNYLIGTVEATRYGQLQEWCAPVAAWLREQQESVPFLREHAAFWPDPLPRYSQILSAPQKVHASIIHGDMNLSNILVYTDNDRITPYLIDFEHTAPGGHTLYDLARLELEYYRTVLIDRGISLEELLRLNLALYRIEVGLKNGLSLLQNSLLIEAYEFVSAIRTIALKELRPDAPFIAPTEYYLALLACSLSALKWDGEKAALLDAEQIAPIVVDYLCAAFATGVISVVSTGALHRDAYPPPPSQRGRPAEPYLGHEVLCDQAVRYILNEPDHPLVVFYGSLGCGRNRLADAVVDRLAAEGYRRIPSIPRFASSAEHLQRVRTVDDLLEQIAYSLPAESLYDFLDTNYRWIGQQRYAALRTILDQKRWEAKSDPQAAGLDRKLPRRNARDAANDLRPEWIKQLGDALYRLLSTGGERLVLALDMTYATVGLRRLVMYLRHLVAAPQAMVLVADSEIADLGHGADQIGRQYTVSLWGREQVKRYCHRRRLFIDDTDPVYSETITRLHQRSNGIPEMVELILKPGQTQDRTEADLSQRIKELENRTIDSDLRTLVIDPLDAPIRSLFALNGLIEASGVPRFSSGSNLSSTSHEGSKLRRHFAKAHLRHLVEANEQADLDTTVELWLQAYDTHQIHLLELGSSLKQIAFQQERKQAPDDLRAWNRWIASYLDEQRVKDQLLIARYWLDAGEEGTARERLEPLHGDPTEAFGTTCNDPLDLIAHIRDRAPEDERAAYASLAGDLASAWGEGSKAIHLYHLALQDIDREEPRYLAVFGQLMRVYQMAETDDASTKMIGGCDDIARSTDPPLLAAFIRGWRAVAVGDLCEDDAELEQATDTLRAAIGEIEIYGQSQSDGAATYWRDRAFLVDALARMEADLGRYPEATALLEREHRTLLRGPSDELLLARFKNNLGFIIYYKLGRTGEQARGYFEEALRIRETYGDQVGAIRSAANLLGLLGEAAKGAKDWASAEEQCAQFIKKAQQLHEVSAAFNLQSNLIELKIRRGAFDQARALIGESPTFTLTDKPDPLISLKTAWCDLWQEELDKCRDTLGLDVFQEEDEPEDRWEWAQCVFELALHGGLAGQLHVAEPLLPAATLITEGQDSYSPSPRANADSAYTHGLRHLVRSELAQAREAFILCRRMWLDKIIHPYRAACAGIWLTFSIYQAGERDKAAELGRQVYSELSLFGDTPALQLLRCILSLINLNDFE